MVEGWRDGIVRDESGGEAPLMPITNRYKPIGTTAEVDFKTTRACHATMKSHIDQVVLDNLVWESSAGFWMESSGAVQPDRGSWPYQVKNSSSPRLSSRRVIGEETQSRTRA